MGFSVHKLAVKAKGEEKYLSQKDKMAYLLASASQEGPLALTIKDKG